MKRSARLFILGVLVVLPSAYYLHRIQGIYPSAIVVHESASRWGNSASIRRWHVSRGWDDIGYHAVILNGRISEKSGYEPALDGKIEPGRPDNRMGMHCSADGMNRKALGVCLIGDPRDPSYPTNKQMRALVHYCAVKCTQHQIPVTNITQHSDHEPGKPLDASLDMAEIRRKVQLEIEMSN